MPFSSQAQSNKCFVTNGFGGKVDCEEFARETDYKHLPKKKRKFKEWLESRTERQGGDRLVRMRNGEGYVTSYNIAFGIVQFGPMKDAKVLTLKDAVDEMKRLNEYPRPGGKLWAELID